MSMFDRHPLAMEEKASRFCSCTEESDIVMAGMLENLDTSKYHINNWIHSSCDQTDHIQEHSLLHYKDISPVFDRAGVIDDVTYVNDQPEGAIHQIVSERMNPISEDEIKPEGVDIHWSIKGQGKVKRATRHTKKVSSMHGGLSYLFLGDLVSSYYSEPVKIHYPTSSGLTEEEVYTICTGAILNSTIAQTCGSFFKDDITSALDFCVSGK